MLRRLVTRYWLLLPLLILTVVLIDRVDTSSSVETEDTIDMSATESDYYLSEFTTRRFNVEGTVEYQLEGETLAHYPADDRSQITEPRVELRRDNVRWFMKSQNGRFDPVPDLITLTGDVTVNRVLPSNDGNGYLGNIVMKTQSLRIANTDNWVETDQEVEIVAPTWQLKATGLRTEIDDGRLQLLSNVVARYQLPSNLLDSESKREN